ncbi:MAG: C1 family peptidase, partial [Saprospiraceae bacterium]
MKTLPIFFPWTRISLLTLFLFSAIGLFAQNDIKLRTTSQLKAFYQNRESKAPATVKTRLAATRTRIANAKLSYQVGYTRASDRPLKQLTGDLPQIPASEITRIKALMLSLPNSDDDKDGDSGALPSKWDSRDKGWVSGVRDQQSCGSCWSFAAVAMYESSFRKRNGGSINASEQQVLDCSGGGDCDGGFSYKVYDWMIDNTKNLRTESSYSYQNAQKSCPTSASNTGYYAKSWKVLRSDGDISKICDANTIKQAIMDYGAVNASLQATDEWSDYTDGVLDGMASNTGNPTSNHAILIIGWDNSKEAFLVKNSWGTDWGLDGFCWVKYDNFNIGRRAAVIIAQKEDCLSFNPNNATVTNDNHIVDGDHSLFAFPNKAEADKTLKIIKKYGFNRTCFVGRPDASFHYSLVGTKSPVGAATGEDCLSFKPANLQVKKDGSQFLLT